MTEKNIFLHFVLCTRTFINVNFQIVIFVFDNRVDFLQLMKCACHFWCIIPKLTSQSACPWTTALTNHGKRRITSKLFKRDVKPFSWKIDMFKFDLHLHFWFESSQVCNMLGFKIVIWAIFFFSCRDGDQAQLSFWTNAVNNGLRDAYQGSKKAFAICQARAHLPIQVNLITFGGFLHNHDHCHRYHFILKWA